MSDQEPGRVHPLEDQDCDENQPTKSRGAINYDIPIISDQQSLWHQNAPTPSSFCIDVHEAAHYSNILDDLSSFEVLSLPLQVNRGEIPCSEDNILTSLERGQSSGGKRKPASDFLEMQTKGEDLQEDEVKEESDTSDQRKQHKRTRCPKLHNQNERLRRQKLKEKMRTLQELIPNCNKRDKTSTLDDAIKYIKTLQYQVQMMSLGASHFHSPMMMMPQPRQQGMQFPSFLQTGPPIGGHTGMKYEIGMGMSGMFSPYDFPMRQVGLPNPCFMPSSATSGLLSEAVAAAAQNPGNFSEPLNVTSSMEWTPFYATCSGFQSTTQGVTSPSSQGPISEQSCTRRESTARVMPSRIIPTNLTKDVKDCESSHSASSKWFFFCLVFFISMKNEFFAF